MEQFNFASFSFPRHIPRLVATGGSKRATRIDTAYYHAPAPDSREGASFYFDSDFAPGLRVEHSAETRGENAFGIVYRLPRNRGFLAGWALGTNMSAWVDHSIYGSARDAIRAANDAASEINQKMRDEEYLQCLEEMSDVEDC
jgi:hypothetical protein